MIFTIVISTVIKVFRYIIVRGVPTVLQFRRSSMKTKSEGIVARTLSSGNRVNSTFTSIKNQNQINHAIDFKIGRKILLRFET